MGMGEVFDIETGRCFFINDEGEHIPIDEPMIVDFDDDCEEYVVWQGLEDCD